MSLVFFLDWADQWVNGACQQVAVQLWDRRYLQIDTDGGRGKTKSYTEKAINDINDLQNERTETCQWIMHQYPGSLSLMLERS